MSIKVIINNSTSQIVGLDRSQWAKIRKLLSYLPDDYAAFTSGFGPRPKYLIDAKGHFPTGLLERVLLWAFAEDLDVDAVDLRVVPTKKINHKPKKAITPYPSQVRAADMLEQNHQGIISMPTGSGKSLVISLIIARLSVRTLVVVPSLEIKKQLLAGLKENFADMSNIAVENIDSKVLEASTGYDLLIIDECHHTAAKTYQTLNKRVWQGVYYRAMLTATPFRNQKAETMLFEGLAGKVIYQLSYKEAVAAGYIVPVEAYYIELPKVETDAVTWHQVYNQLVVDNTERNLQISALILRLQKAGISTLCLVKEVAHGTILADMTGLPFIHGQDEESRDYVRQFNSGEIKVLIGTEGILGEGVDTKPCEFVVIAGLGKAKSQFMQKVGRAVRKYPGKESAKVILIKDRSHRFTLKHFNKQVTILKDEYGVKPIKL